MESLPAMTKTLRLQRRGAEHLCWEKARRSDPRGGKWRRNPSEAKTGKRKFINWSKTVTRGGLNDSLWGVQACSGSVASRPRDQGHFIISCPAATLLSTGLTNARGGRGGGAASYGDRSQGYGCLIKISFYQERKQQRKEGWGKRRWSSILPFFKVLTNKCALLLAWASHFHSACWQELRKKCTWWCAAVSAVQRETVPRLSFSDVF